MAAGKRIGILTSGGDCAGLNAVIRAVASRARTLGWTVVGIRNGTAGLLARPVDAVELGPEVLGANMLRQGGTILGTTNKGDPFAFPTADGQSDRPHRRGDRRLPPAQARGADRRRRRRQPAHPAQRSRSQGGIPLVGIPKTIDNDLGLTEVSDRLRDRCRRRHRRARPPAADRRQPQPRHGAGGDGPRCRPYRAHGRHRRRRRRDPDPGDPLPHRQASPRRSRR